MSQAIDWSHEEVVGERRISMSEIVLCLPRSQTQDPSEAPNSHSRKLRAKFLVPSAMPRYLIVYASSPEYLDPGEDRQQRLNKACLKQNNRRYKKFMSLPLGD